MADSTTQLRIDPRSLPVPAETLVVGVAQMLELRDLAVKLMQQQKLRVYLLPDLEDACDYCRRNDIRIDLIVLLLNHPDELLPADVQRIVVEWPLARVVAVGSVWLSSALRTRGHYPVGWLVNVEEASWRIDAEVEVVRGERQPLPHLANYADAAGWKLADKTV